MAVTSEALPVRWSNSPPRFYDSLMPSTGGESSVAFAIGRSYARFGSKQKGRAMKWVTRDFVHLDRVASPWLIKRFIDRDAVFVFVPWGAEERRPADAIPFALPGAEIGPHDQEGTT